MAMMTDGVHRSAGTDLPEGGDASRYPRGHPDPPPDLLRGRECHPGLAETVPGGRSGHHWPASSRMNRKNACFVSPPGKDTPREDRRSRPEAARSGSISGIASSILTECKVRGIPCDRPPWERRSTPRTRGRQLQRYEVMNIGSTTLRCRYGRSAGAG
jgi:hypothetical protein